MDGPINAKINHTKTAFGAGLPKIKLAFIAYRRATCATETSGDVVC